MNHYIRQVFIPMLSLFAFVSFAQAGTKFEDESFRLEFDKAFEKSRVYAAQEEKIQTHKELKSRGYGDALVGYTGPLVANSYGRALVKDFFPTFTKRSLRDPSKLFKLGKFYTETNNRDLDKAVHFLLAAQLFGSKKSDPLIKSQEFLLILSESLHELGIEFETGKNRPKNQYAAHILFADNLYLTGSQDSALSLADMHRNDRGIGWWNKARSTNYKFAKYSLEQAKCNSKTAKRAAIPFEESKCKRAEAELAALTKAGEVIKQAKTQKTTVIAPKNTPAQILQPTNSSQAMSELRAKMKKDALSPLYDNIDGMWYGAYKCSGYADDTVVVRLHLVDNHYAAGIRLHNGKDKEKVYKLKASNDGNLHFQKGSGLFLKQFKIHQVSDQVVFLELSTTSRKCSNLILTSMQPIKGFAGKYINANGMGDICHGVIEPWLKTARDIEQAASALTYSTIGITKKTNQYVIQSLFSDEYFSKHFGISYGSVPAKQYQKLETQILLCSLFVGNYAISIPDSMIAHQSLKNYRYDIFNQKKSKALPRLKRQPIYQQLLKTKKAPDTFIKSDQLLSDWKKSINPNNKVLSIEKYLKSKVSELNNVNPLKVIDTYKVISDYRRKAKREENKAKKHAKNNNPEALKRKRFTKDMTTLLEPEIAKECTLGANLINPFGGGHLKYQFNNGTCYLTIMKGVPGAQFWVSWVKSGQCKNNICDYAYGRGCSGFSNEFCRSMRKEVYKGKVRMKDGHPVALIGRPKLTN